MNALLNWKTTLAGVVLVLAAALHTFFGVNIPGFTMDLGTAITAGIGLIVAGDAVK
jgi:hypothetical protein